MSSSEPKHAGIIDSVKRVGESALALLHNRLQLFSVELQEEKLRFIQALVWLCAGVILVFLGLAIGVGAVDMLVYEKWRVAGLADLTVLLLIIGAILLGVMWNRLKSNGPPFSGTIQELKKDGEWIQRKN
jgi:uncharacterized membrane protein YqjE